MKDLRPVQAATAMLVATGIFFAFLLLLELTR